MSNRRYSPREGPYLLNTRAADEKTLIENKFQKSGLFNNGFYGQEFAPTEYCRLFA